MCHTLSDNIELYPDVIDLVVPYPLKFDKISTSSSENQIIRAVTDIL